MFKLPCQEIILARYGRRTRWPGCKTSFDSALGLLPIVLCDILVLFPHIQRVLCLLGAVADGHADADLTAVSDLLI